MKKIEESPINMFLIDSPTSLHSSREVPVTRYPTKRGITKMKFTPCGYIRVVKGSALVTVVVKLCTVELKQQLKGHPPVWQGKQRPLRIWRGRALLTDVYANWRTAYCSPEAPNTHREIQLLVWSTAAYEGW